MHFQSPFGLFFYRFGYNFFLAYFTEKSMARNQAQQEII